MKRLRRMDFALCEEKKMEKEVAMKYVRQWNSENIWKNWMKEK